MDSFQINIYSKKLLFAYIFYFHDIFRFFQWIKKIGKNHLYKNLPLLIKSINIYDKGYHTNNLMTDDEINQKNKIIN